MTINRLPNFNFIYNINIICLILSSIQKYFIKSIIKSYNILYNIL